MTTSSPAIVPVETPPRAFDAVSRTSPHPRSLNLNRPATQIRMYCPVKARPTDPTPILGFAQFQSEAAAMLGARAELRQVTFAKAYPSTAAAQDDARKLKSRWVDRIKAMHGFEVSHPQACIPRLCPDGLYRLEAAMFTLAQDLPVGRTVEEAVSDPVARLPHMPGVTEARWKSHTVTKREANLKAYAKAATVERIYRDLFNSGAAKLEATEDGCFRARLTYWRLPAMSLARDRQRVGSGENYDLLLHAPEGTLFQAEIGPLGLPDEGSGRPMGS